VDDLFELSMPWWEFVLRGAVCYIGLLLLLRLTGKRSFGEMSPFDIVVLIIVGGALRSAMVGKDASLLGPFIVVATILVIDMLIGAIAARSPGFDRLLEGRSVLLVRNGREIDSALRRNGISEAAFQRELRSKELRGVEQVEEARLEANGRISFLKRE
jgi:uncharacterized membrane protein YcaP (DUF421 family)